MAGENLLLEIEDLSVGYKVYGGLRKVLDGIHLKLAKGDRVGIVGETGCGKTTIMKSIMNVLPKEASVQSGEIRFRGQNVLTMKSRQLAQFRRKGAGMIFQDPMVALNPVFTVGTQMVDVIRHATGSNSKESREAALQALRDVALPDVGRIIQSYPVQLSGGMRQRVLIAMTIAVNREILLADEPGTALDVTIQDQVLRLIQNLVDEKQLSIVLASHSLGVLREMTNRVYVLYAGAIAETGPTRKIFDNPKHPYTQALMDCVPKLTGAGIPDGIPGRMPNYLHPPKGCRFYDRCPFRMEICKMHKPPSVEIEENHHVSCFLYDESQVGE